MLFVYTITRYTNETIGDILFVQGVDGMFELKTNEEIGAYLKKVILSKYPSCRQFCVAYIDLTIDFSDDPQDLRSEEIRKLTNRLSQILKGKKGIQTYDLPIFSELLGISCEQMLSAGAVAKPITNRRTNYNIAFSTDERDWIEYMNREDCIASYADEFGKTVVDYAIEFKNYGFIRFLIENGYITLISDNKGYVDFNFGASTTLKVRPYEAKTFQNELYENKILRTQIISLALENNDYDVLYEMRAREFPPQLTMVTHSVTSVKFSEYYDENFIDAILDSKVKAIQYFCEEYYVESKWQKEQFLWMFPFLGELIVKAVKRNSSKASMLLDAAIKHNEETYNALKKSILQAAKHMKSEFCRNQGFQEVIADVLRDFHISEEKNVISFYCYFIKGVESVTTNIICADVKSKKPEIQDKLDRLNELYSQIVNIEDHLIKK